MISITQDRSKLGFIGIGAMGSRIAGRLLTHGFQVTVFDRNPDKANALIASGAIMARSKSRPLITTLTPVFSSPIRLTRASPSSMVAEVSPAATIRRSSFPRRRSCSIPAAVSPEPCHCWARRFSS